MSKIRTATLYLVKGDLIPFGRPEISGYLAGQNVFGFQFAIVVKAASAFLVS
jgi:hypothetical protein